MEMGWIITYTQKTDWWALTIWSDDLDAIRHACHVSLARSRTHNICLQAKKMFSLSRSPSLPLSCSPPSPPLILHNILRSFYVEISALVSGRFNVGFLTFVSGSFPYIFNNTCIALRNLYDIRPNAWWIGISMMMWWFGLGYSSTRRRKMFC